MTGPESTRAGAAPGQPDASDATRAGERRGLVTGQERRRLRAALGWELYSRRLARGWAQSELAQRAGVSDRHVRDLERGQVRPSDRMCTVLARALEEGGDDLAVAVTDVRLRRAAGESLRVWNRRRPPRARVQRLYARAEAVVDAQADAERARRDEGAAAWLAALDEAWTAGPEPAPRSPAEAWPERWPPVR